MLLIAIGFEALISYAEYFTGGYTWWDLPGMAIHSGMTFLWLGGHAALGGLEEHGHSMADSPECDCHLYPRTLCPERNCRGGAPHHKCPRSGSRVAQTHAGRDLFHPGSSKQLQQLSEQHVGGGSAETQQLVSEQAFDDAKGEVLRSVKNLGAILAGDSVQYGRFIELPQHVTDWLETSRKIEALEPKNPVNVHEQETLQQRWHFLLARSVRIW